MLRIRSFGLICAVVALLFATADDANASSLITNGGFEDTTHFVNQGHDTMGLFPGDTALVGWTIINSSNLDMGWVGPTNDFVGIVAEEGHYSLDLTGYHDYLPASEVTQSIHTTAGAHYTLTFALGGSYEYDVGGLAGITASAGTTSQNFTYNAPSAPGNPVFWATETLNFTANSSSTLISLVGSTSGKYIGLDNVSVTQTSLAVPEPSTFALGGLGGIGLAICAYRRRRSAVN